MTLCSFHLSNHAKYMADLTDSERHAEREVTTAGWSTWAGTSVALAL